MNKQNVRHNHFSKICEKEMNENLRKLNERVSKSIIDESSIVINIAREEEANEAKSTRGERLADKVAEFGGSWKFIIIFGIILLFWIVLNTVIMMSKAFDPYPFILMNLILSTIAALQAPVIMMSQNRQEGKDRERNRNDYLINMKSESEIMALHEKVDIMSQEQYSHIIRIQGKQLDLIQDLQKQLQELVKSN
ncbi:MAG: DUF1003 domain-containing protein [Bacteroidota bacterium]|nr:DUF1003 domain-containing protein [Bacteroidota bacterium]